MEQGEPVYLKPGSCLVPIGGNGNEHAYSVCQRSHPTHVVALDLESKQDWKDEKRLVMIYKKSNDRIRRLVDLLYVLETDG